MSYTFLAESGEESSAESFSDIPRFVLSRSIPSVDVPLSSVNATVFCHASQYGTTSERLTQGPGRGSTSSAVDSPVRISASPEGVRVSKASAPASGEKCGESFARFDLDTSSWKTHQLYLFEDSTPSSVTWPRWGTMRTGECSQQRPLAPPTFARDSTFWPTPTATNATKGRYGISKTGRLRFSPEVVENVLKLYDEFGWKTIPATEEWLMGWPIGWTGLEPLGTDKFRQWLLLHGVAYRTVDAGGRTL